MKNDIGGDGDTYDHSLQLHYRQFLVFADLPSLCTFLNHLWKIGNAMINNNFSPFFLGSTCLFEDVVTSPDIIQLAHKSGLSTFIVSAGLQENIEQNLSSTLQCAITVQCSDCSPQYMRDVTLDSCLSNKDIGSVPSGHYMISLNISSSCGETIITDPLDIQIGKLLHKCYY